MLSVDIATYAGQLARHAGGAPEDFGAGLRDWSDRAMNGAATLADAFREVLVGCGLDVDDSHVDELVLFEVALGRLGVASETVFVDVQPTFCDAAAALGIHALAIGRSGRPGTVTRLAEGGPSRPGSERLDQQGDAVSACPREHQRGLVVAGE